LRTKRRPLNSGWGFSTPPRISPAKREELRGGGRRPKVRGALPNIEIRKVFQFGKRESIEKTPFSIVVYPERNGIFTCRKQERSGRGKRNDQDWKSYNGTTFTKRGVNILTTKKKKEGGL